ncbi:MAG: class I SAM-dependent methyltransferase [Bacteroidetes bacterium]|nr:class I SAM-dependent methyltransferase [Bacteroidota bacterium]
MTLISSANFQLSINYIHHLFSAGNEYSVHSPFVFNLLTQGIYKKNPDAVFTKIETIRKNLLHDKRELQVIDLGAGSSFDGLAKTRSIKTIAKNFAKAPSYCRLLYRITEYLKPSIMVELGTSLGISAMYQSAGNPSGKLFTLEGCPETAMAAVENFEKNNFNTISCLTGNFNETLPILLNELKVVDYAFIDGNHTYEATINYFELFKKHCHENTVLVFDDINWSSGMKKAWAKIKSDPAVTISLDFFLVGIVFFNKGFSKQDFLLRL